MIAAAVASTPAVVLAAMAGLAWFCTWGRTLMRFLLRELHRSWFLWWRLPLAEWHQAAADRHRRAADRHEASMLATSRRALDLSRRYPSMYRGRGDVGA